MQFDSRLNWSISIMCELYSSSYSSSSHSHSFLRCHLLHPRPDGVEGVGCCSSRFASKRVQSFFSCSKNLSALLLSYVSESNTNNSDSAIDLDECLFSKKTFKPLAWADKFANVTQSKFPSIQPFIAALAAMSATEA